MEKQLEEFKSDNAFLKSKVRILNEVILEEQEKMCEEELKRKAEEEKSRHLEAKLEAVEKELLAVKSQIDLSPQTVTDVKPSSSTNMNCSPGFEVRAFMFL